MLAGAALMSFSIKKLFTKDVPVNPNIDHQNVYFVEDKLSDESMLGLNGSVFDDLSNTQSITTNPTADIPVLQDTFETVDYLRVPTLIEPKHRIGILANSREVFEQFSTMLSGFEISAQHFSVPERLAGQHILYFDRVPAWIICIPEGENDDFIDDFIDRYIDVPTLFIFEQHLNLISHQKVHAFIATLVK